MRYRLLIILTATALIASGCNLYTWGRNTDGQLGNGTTTDVGVPVNQNTDVGYFNDWVDLSAGNQHACGIREAGTLWCWGRNFDPETQTNSPANVLPVQVGTAAVWQSVDAGEDHSCAIKVNGTLWCWGDNTESELGGSGSTTAAPRQVNPGTTWNQVSAGADFTCAIRGDDSLWCWGSNVSGQLGVGSTTAVVATPTAVGNTAVNWTHLDTGWGHACGVRGNDTAWCWGSNNNGSLGDGTTTDSNTPVQVGSSADWDQIETDFTTCGIRTNQSLWCWGGALPSPTEVSGGGNWIDVALATDVNTCAIRADNSLWCWGQFTSPISGPLPQQRGTETWTTVDGIYGSLCGIQTDGSSYCENYENYHGQAGSGWRHHIYGDADLAEPVGANQDFTAVSAGGSLTCALRISVWCWGETSLYQDDSDSSIAEILRTRAGSRQRLSVGRDHVCVDFHDEFGQYMYCYGDNTYGQTNYLVGGDTQQVDSFSAGAFHTCAIGTSSYEFGLRCTGLNNAGQLGNGTTTNGTGGKVGNGTEIWQQVDAGEAHTCAIQLVGTALAKTIWCWGANGGGRLGDGSTTTRTSPAQIGIDGDWEYVDAGGTHTCAIKTNGQLWCWGTNNRGQLGQGDTTNRLSPTRVGTASNWTHVTTGFNFTCGLRTAPIGHDLYCWGANNNGRLGDGTTTQRNTPVEIGAGTNWATVDAGDGHVAATRTTD